MLPKPSPVAAATNSGSSMLTSSSPFVGIVRPFRSVSTASSTVTSGSAPSRELNSSFSVSALLSPPQKKKDVAEKSGSESSSQGVSTSALREVKKEPVENIPLKLSGVRKKRKKPADEYRVVDYKAKFVVAELNSSVWAENGNLRAKELTAMPSIVCPDKTNSSKVMMNDKPKDGAKTIKKLLETESHEKSQVLHTDESDSSGKRETHSGEEKTAVEEQQEKPKETANKENGNLENTEKSNEASSKTAEPVQTSQVNNGTKSNNTVTAEGKDETRKNDSVKETSNVELEKTLEKTSADDTFVSAPKTTSSLATTSTNSSVSTIAEKVATPIASKQTGTSCTSAEDASEKREKTSVAENTAQPRTNVVVNTEVENTNTTETDSGRGSSPEKDFATGDESKKTSDSDEPHDLVKTKVPTPPVKRSEEAKADEPITVGKDDTPPSPPPAKRQKIECAEKVDKTEKSMDQSEDSRSFVSSDTKALSITPAAAGQIKQ